MKIVKKLIYILIILLVIRLLFFKSNKQCEKFENEIKTYLINLDRSTDRLKDMTEKCKKANINFERFPAYDGSKLNLNKMIDDKILVKESNMMVGAIGCSMSHLNLWKQCINRGDELVLVIEDDCIIPENFWEKFSNYYKQLPQNWDVFYLGASSINGRKISDNILIPNIISASTENTGTYAMLIKKSILNVLYNNVLPIRNPIDVTIKNYLFSKINVYMANPPIITHDNEIDSMRRVISNRSGTPKWFKNVQNVVKVTN